MAEMLCLFNWKLLGSLRCIIFLTSTHPTFNSFQRLVAFMAELRGADSLLQKAINKVDCSKTMDTAQVDYTCSSCKVTQFILKQISRVDFTCCRCCRKCNNASRNRRPQWERCWKTLDWLLCKEKEGPLWPEWGERSTDFRSLRTTGTR